MFLYEKYSFDGGSSVGHEIAICCKMFAGTNGATLQKKWFLKVDTAGKGNLECEDSG